MIEVISSIKLAEGKKSDRGRDRNIYSQCYRERIHEEKRMNCGGVRVVWCVVALWCVVVMVCSVGELVCVCVGVVCVSDGV